MKSRRTDIVLMMRLEFEPISRAACLFDSALESVRAERIPWTPFELRRQQT